MIKKYITTQQFCECSLHAYLLSFILVLNMELQIALAFLLMLFSVIWIFLNKYFQNIKKLPPGPTKIPIFGSLPFLPKEVKGATKRIQVWMNEQYGPICKQLLIQLYSKSNILKAH